MNVPALLGVLRAVRDPSLILPHASVAHIAQLQVPVSSVFAAFADSEKPPRIKAVVLDKDNCIATPLTNAVHPSCAAAVAALKQEYSPDHLLIVSNSSGLSSKDADGEDARALEQATGLPVLRHAAPKPSQACAHEILAHFAEHNIGPREIAVVGDRLCTDTLLAKRMGSWSVWVREGVVADNGLYTRAEYAAERLVRRLGFTARPP